jgi:glycosyltransferase involved in cell wall biosynthesis
MRILHLTSHLNAGGVSSHILSLSHALTRRGHRVAIASGGGSLEPQAAADGIVHWEAPLHTSAEFSPQVFRAGRQVLARLRAEPVDVMHAHTRVGQVVAARLSRRTGIPYVATWHGFFRPNLGRRLWPCTGDRTIAISEPVRRHLFEDFRVPAERVRLIWNGVDVDHFAQRPAAESLARFRAQHGLPERGPVVGGIGRLASGRIKGFDLLLEAGSLLAQRRSDLTVLIAGDGPRRLFLEEKARRFGMEQRVRFAGTVSDVRVPLGVLDVFMFSSRWPEGFGLSLVEAMAAGRPVVATRVGVVPEIIEDGRDGLLVEPEDARALAAAVARLLDDPAAAARLGQAAQRRARERFSLERMASEVEAVYGELVNTAHG